MGTTTAYCFRDGLVLFNKTAPEGAVELCRGPCKDVFHLIAETTEDGWIDALRHTKSVADDQQALLLYLEQLKDAAPTSVQVAELTRELEAVHE